jgi:hypothetical protein
VHTIAATRWLFTLVTLGASACTEPPAPRYAPAERIAGSWAWVASVNVKTGERSTPSSVGVVDTLTFVAQSERQGSYTFLRSGMTQIAGTFLIGSEDGPGNDFITVSSSLPFLARTAWLAAGTDSLQLNGVFEGGFRSTYARVK